MADSRLHEAKSRTFDTALVAPHEESVGENG
jgi:hypothetical protein